MIATREFEKRMAVIHQTKDNAVLDLYVNHLEYNLSEVDALAVKHLKSTKSDFVNEFEKFEKQNCGKVKLSDDQAEMLKEYYSEQQKKFKKELEDLESDHQKELNKKSKSFEKIANQYKKVLWKREKHRMEKIGFKWSKTGWLLVGNKFNVILADTPKQVNIRVANGADFDRVHTYAIHPDIQSIHNLPSSNKVDFYSKLHYFGDLNFKHKYFVSIGYKGKDVYMDVQDYNDNDVNLTLSRSSESAMRSALTKYDAYGKNNSILKDLEFQNKIYEENKRLNKIQDEMLFMLNLHYAAILHNGEF